MMGWYDGSWGWMGMLFMVLFWGVIIGLIVWGISRLTQRPQDTTSPYVESPRQILDRRFASGELTEEQYAAARRALDGRSVDEAPRS